MSDHIDTIEEVIDEIKHGKTLTHDRMQEYADDLLYDESSNNACRVFFTLAEKKLFISDLVFERLCNIIIDNHQQITKENSIRIIDILIENGRNPSYLCLKTLSIALQNQQTATLRRYGSKILYNLIKTHSTLRLNSSLLNAMSHALNDPLTTVQSYMLYSFEELVRNQRYDIPQQSIDNMEAILSNIYQDVNKNYGKCGLMASFFLNLLYRQYKLNENVLVIFSELLIVEVVSHKDLFLNRSASYVLQKAIENQLFIGHLTPKVLNNISICFNSISSQHKELLEYCLRMLCALNEDQLISTRLDIKLLKQYLKDTNLEENTRSYMAILLGNLCKISYQNIDNDFNMSILEDTIDVLIEQLDHEKLLQSSIYALKNIAQYKQDYLSIFPLRKFVTILSKDSLNSEIRQNVCLILSLIIENNQPITQNEIDGLINALNDSDKNISNTAFIALKNFFQNDYSENENLSAIIKTYAENISTLLIDILLNSNEILAINAAILLNIISEKNFKTYFTNSEINYIHIVLQTHRNQSVRQYCLDLLNRIRLKQINIPKNVYDLIELEKIIKYILKEKTLNKFIYIELENKLHAYFNDTTFDNKFLPLNMFDVYAKILETQICSSTILVFLLRCVKDNQKVPTQLIETLINQLCINKNIKNNEILIEILYYAVYNGQSLNDKMMELFSDFFLKSQFYSIYTIQIFKLLTSRNEIRIDTKIYEKCVNLLQCQQDYDIQINLIEILAYAIQNIPVDDELLRNHIMTLMEKYFQKKDTSREIKYYSCVVLTALTEHRTRLSDITLNLLKYYAQDDESDDKLTKTTYSSTINLRDISLKTLEKYVTMYQASKDRIDIDEIKQIINREILGQKILEGRNSTNRLKVAKDLLSIVQNGQQSLSKYNMKILEVSLYSNDSSIELKVIIINIFEYISAHLNSSEIRLILSLINDKTFSTNIINVLKQLVYFKKTFSIETLNILIDFASENTNSTSRDNVIDCLDAIIKYQTISSHLEKRIRFEILSKNIRDSTLNTQRKQTAVNECLNFVQDGFKLSTNTIESLEYALKNLLETNKITEAVFHIIELAVRNGQKLPSTLINLLSHLTNDKRRLFEILKFVSNNNPELITQEILDNSEDYLLQNFSKSYSIFLKGVQNGCKLTKTIIRRLGKTLENNDNTSPNQRLDIIKILKNLAENTETIDETVIRYLENAFNDSDNIIHQSILNILKCLPDYQPSSKFLIYLQNILEQHPCYSTMENILDQCYTLPIQVKLHIIYIYLVIEYVENDIIDKPLKFVCRELLCNDLLARIYEHDKYDKINQFEFYSNLNTLEYYFHFQPYSVDRDEILVFFIGNHSNFTLKDINEILLLMKTNFEALQILRIASNDWLEKLQIHWLHTIIRRYQHIKLNANVTLTNDIAEKIINLLIMKLKFGVSLSECFLQRIHSIEDFNQLVLFLKYLYEKNINKELDLHDYFTRTDGQKIITKDLDSWDLEIQCDLIKKKLFDLCKLRNFNELNLLQSIQTTIMLSYVNDWPLEVFKKLFDILEAKQDEPFPLLMKNFLDTLTVISNYGIQHGVLDNHGKNAESIFKLKDSNQWPLAMHKFAVSVSFDLDERQKTLKDLIDEIKKNNDIENNKQLNDTIENLEETYRNIMLTYNLDSKFYSIGKPIKHWDENDVKKWSEYYKKSSKQYFEQSTYELICVVKRAIFLHNKKQQFEPRTIQILSLLLMLSASNANIARLAQIKTGEGKSVIIAMFAAIKALNGHKVDIVTTSPLLAKRDAENKQQFYTMLNLTAGENSGMSTTKSCYKNDVVYGNVNDFQFDILKDEYSLLGTRCQRKFDIAIVDEVDSMLIDDNSKICRLSSKIPAIDELKVLLTVIWQELNRTYDKIVRINDKIYCITAPFRMNENGEIILLKPAKTDENGNVIDTVAAAADDDDENDFQEIDNPYEFIENHIKNYIENYLLKPNEKNQCLLNIPKHLISFVKQQLNKWTLSAWQAKLFYHENIDYLLINSKDSIQSIVPIDYRNTGIIQMNTSWPDGLHQFLQIKHRLRISAESLTTNFLSNVAFFSRYGKNLFGLTGTLGSKEAKDLIRYIYNVDFVVIPPYKYTQFIAYTDQLNQSEQEWLNNCTKSIYNEAKINQRAVLVICETKSDVSKIHEKLIEKDDQLKKQIKLYTRSDNEEQNAINNELDCGQIIVATNLAGRGTDIGTTHKIEENGGLHVLVTFLPLNTRVEHQAFGRTSRQGKRGTAQLIVLAPANGETKYDNIMQLKEYRDEQEKRHIDRAKRIELNRIERRDKLFGKFCDLRTELRQKENDKYKLDCVEELWGFWLKTTFSNEDSTDDKDDDLSDQLLDTKFEEFRSKILADYNSVEIFQNPFYLILKANEYIFEKKNYEEAISFLRSAIKSDPIFTLSARYNLAYALIKQKNHNKTEAKSELEAALKIIDEILIPQQEMIVISFRTASNDTHNNTTNTKSDVEDQIMNRINLLCLCKNQMEQAKTVIDDAESKDHNVRMKYKKLDEFFSDINKPTLDINEFKENGILGFFQLTQKEPTPWLSIIAVSLIGIAQAVAGAAIIAFTAGATASIGYMLLTEGIGDMITAIRSAIIGEFSWKEYAIQKAISIAITIATCGMAALKQTGQAIKYGFKGCANIIKSASIGGKQLIGQFTKEGWILVGKQIGQAFVKAGTKEILKTVLDKTILTQLSKRINEEIHEHIQKRVNSEIKLNQTIKDFLIIDAGLHRSNACHNEIENLVNRILHPQSNRFLNAAISIVQGITNQLTNGISARALKIFTAGKCLADLLKFLDEFFIEFKRDLDKLRDKLKIDHLLYKNNSNNIDQRTAKEITEQLKKEKYVEKDNIKIIKPLNLFSMNLKEYKKHENYVVQICNNIYSETTKHSEYEFEKNMITKTLTDRLATYMTNCLNAELINPVVHTGVDVTVDHLSNKIQNAYADSRGTLHEQIENRRAQNYVIRGGRDIWKHANKDTQRTNTQRDEQSIDPNVEKLAQNVENGAPGDLKDIMAIGTKLGRPTQIFRNGVYDMTIGDMNAGEPLKVNFGENKTGDIGHYTSVDSSTVIIPTGAKNCCFDTLSAQTNLSSTELRQMAADVIRENSDLYAKMMPSIHYLAEHQNQNLLYIGGTNNQSNRIPGRKWKYSAERVNRILSDPRLPPKEELSTALDNLIKLIEKHNKSSEANTNLINSQEILQTLKDDLDNADVSNVIAESRVVRNIFYDSINRRLEDFRHRNNSVLTKMALDTSSDEIARNFDSLASTWKTRTHCTTQTEVYFSQHNVNTYFRGFTTSEAQQYLPKTVLNRLAASQDPSVRQEGKQIVEDFGPSVLPVRYFVHENKTVVINNRGLMAHRLAGCDPNRLIPSKPTKVELDRLKKEGMPRRKLPEFDKN